MAFWVVDVKSREEEGGRGGGWVVESKQQPSSQRSFSIHSTWQLLKERVHVKCEFPNSKKVAGKSG